jgi:hypothetical protein
VARTEGNDEGFGHWFLVTCDFRREDHLDRDEEENDAATDGESFLLQVEKRHEPLSAEEEGEQDDEGDDQLPGDDPRAALDRHGAQAGNETRHIAERVHGDDQQKGRRKNVHAPGDRL